MQDDELLALTIIRDCPGSIAAGQEEWVSRRRRRAAHGESGSFGAAVLHLLAKGYVRIEPDDTITLTEAGRALVPAPPGRGPAVR